MGNQDLCGCRDFKVSMGRTADNLRPGLVSEIMKSVVTLYDSCKVGHPTG